MAVFIKYLDSTDSRMIQKWPIYKKPYEELDYALRKGGWLDTIGSKPSCKQYGYYVNNILVAFSLLDFKTNENAEFYIAVKGDSIHQGIGKQFCIETLRIGFEKLNLCRIYLRVRTNHSRGIRLYNSVGFKHIGETWEITNSVNTHFYLMEIYKSEFGELMESF